MPGPTTSNTAQGEQTHTPREAPEVQISTEEQHEILEQDEEMDLAADRDRIRVVCSPRAVPGYHRQRHPQRRKPHLYIWST